LQKHKKVGWKLTEVTNEPACGFTKCKRKPGKAMLSEAGKTRLLTDTPPKEPLLEIYENIAQKEKT
jgi:hypothetical protein